MGRAPAQSNVTGSLCRSAAIKAAEHPATPEPMTINLSLMSSFRTFGLGSWVRKE